LNLSQADRVIAAARTGTLLENFSYHSKVKIRDSTLISHFSASFSFQAAEEHRSRYDRSLGGGSFLDLGCYGVDFAHRLFDCDLEILDVRATRKLDWGDADETCAVQARAGGVPVQIAASFAQPMCQEFALRFTDGSEQSIPRADDTIAMLRAFADMRESDPADLLRWRRNAAVYEQVLARMQYQRH
jgi:predicted dehydrogenase